MIPILLLGILGAPFLVWGTSYLFLVREFGKWNLIHTKIHESGKYNLLETLFYFNHFLRELPIDTLYSFAILWSYRAAGVQRPEVVLRPVNVLIPACLVLFVGFVFTGSLLSVGLRATLADLFQLRERDDIAGWGSHWQMHFLSTAALLFLLIIPGTLFPGAASFLPDLTALFGGFLGLSLVFKTGLKAINHTRWILHGARETFTYFFIVAIPALTPLLDQTTIGIIRIAPFSVMVLTGLLIISVYFLYVYSQSDLNEMASSKRGLIFLISSHFFEHFLDYIYILLLVTSMVLIT